MGAVVSRIALKPEVMPLVALLGTYETLGYISTYDVAIELRLIRMYHLAEHALYPGEPVSTDDLLELQPEISDSGEQTSPIPDLQSSPTSEVITPSAPNQAPASHAQFHPLEQRYLRIVARDTLTNFKLAGALSFFTVERDAYAEYSHPKEEKCYQAKFPKVRTLIYEERAPFLAWFEMSGYFPSKEALEDMHKLCTACQALEDDAEDNIVDIWDRGERQFEMEAISIILYNERGNLLGA